MQRRTRSSRERPRRIRRSNLRATPPKPARPGKLSSMPVRRGVMDPPPPAHRNHRRPARPC
jgi:hypothetical protein